MPAGATGATRSGTLAGKATQAGVALALRSPGSVVVSRGGPSVHKTALGSDARPAQTLPPMPGVMVDGVVHLRLTPQQVGEVLRNVSVDGAVSVIRPASDWELPSSTVLDERSRQAEGTQFSMSLIRGLLVLAYFMSGKPVGVSDMAAELQMEPSTASRLIHTLELLGLIERDPGTGRSRIVR